jgi:hypothetical protein
MDLNALLQPQTLATMIPILGIVWLIVASIARHRERMAMIEKGMDPNAPKRLEGKPENERR